MEYYVTKPADYWIAQNAINITLNALGKPNRIQCSVASGAAILCYIEGVDGLGYDNGHRFRTWPLTISPTYFNSNTEKYVYVAIPRSASVGTQAVVVFPSEKLDIYGKNVGNAQIGSTDYYYIWLQGILTATDGTSNREWQQAIDFGKKGTDEDLYDDTSSDWYQYSKVSEVVTFLKNIAMKAGTTFHNLILGYKELTGVATSDIAYTDSDTLVATPGYIESQYLSKTHESEAQEVITFVKGVVARMTSSFQGISNSGSIVNEGDVTTATISGSNQTEGLEVLTNMTLRKIVRGTKGYFKSLFSDSVETDNIKSSNYTGDDIADTGFRLTNSHNGHSKLTIDEIYVRMKAVFESLEVKERTYSGGDQIWSCAGNRIIRVDYLGNVEDADHVPQMMNVHADGRPEGQGQGDVYSVPVPGDTYGYSDVKVPWLLRQMPLLARAKVFARYRKVRIVINEPAGNSANRAAASESPLANIRRARCYFLAKDDDMEVHNWWRINDLARCQTMNLANTTRQTYISGEGQKAGNIFWWRKVIGVSYEPVTLDDGKQYHYFDVAFDYEYEQSHPEVMATSVMEGSDIPAAQDSVVQFGNTIIEGRMNLMMMEVNGGDAVGYNPTTDAPCLKAYRGVYCFDLNKSWVGGRCCKMKLSPKSGYEFYGPNFKMVTEYDVVPVPMDRGLWNDIIPTRDDYSEHANVRKCYYYDKVSHNGSYWLCSIVDGSHWVDSNDDYISDAAYSALTEEQKALCSRKQNYTIEEPSANSIDWTEVVQKGADGRDADVWTIGDDGYWYKNGLKTDIKAEGTDGTGVEIKGGVDVLFNADKTSQSQTSLEELTGVAVGDCYTVSSNKHLYFYNGTNPASAGVNPAGWRDLGKFIGDDGQSSYMHIAYADSDANGDMDPSTFTIVKQKNAYDWIGLCTNNSPTDPTVYTTYEWNKVKGAKGDSIYKTGETVGYQVSDNGTTTPSGIWYSTKQAAIDAYNTAHGISGHDWQPDTFMWTQTTITWSDNNTTVLYGAERNPNDGADGMSIVIASQNIDYCRRTAYQGQADPSTLTYGAYPSALNEGDWLYTRTTIVYATSGGAAAGTTVSYSVSRIGADGDNGSGITGITEHYKASALDGSDAQHSESTPSGSSPTDWSTNPMPSDWGETDGKIYLWNYEKIAKTDGQGNVTYERTAASVVAIWTKGIDSITNYYKASASASGETRPAIDPTTGAVSGWTTSVQAPTQAKPYLWNYEKITYTDGTTTYTDPHVIGHYGKDADVWTIGDDGYWYKNGVKTDVKAEGTNGTGVEIKGGVDVLFNADKSSQAQTSLEGLTGVAVGDCYTVSANKHLYFYDGTTPASAGINPAGWRDIGKFSGDDGLSSYMHIAYADSDANGDMDPSTFTIVKQKNAYDWIGLCTNNSSTDPTVYTAYEWNKVKGDKGDDAVNVMVSPEEVLITQSNVKVDGQYPLDLTNAESVVSVNVGGVPQSFVISNIVGTHCTASLKSGTTDTVKITAIGTYTETVGQETVTRYYDSGYVTFDITADGKTYQKRINFYCNLLGTWRETVEAGTREIVAEEVDYNFIDGKLYGQTSYHYNDVSSAAMDYEQWSSVSATVDGSKANMNIRISTAEGNISIVTQKVNNGKNLFSGVLTGDGWKSAATVNGTLHDVTIDDDGFMNRASGDTYIISPPFGIQSGITYKFSFKGVGTSNISVAVFKDDLSRNVAVWNAEYNSELQRHVAGLVNTFTGSVRFLVSTTKIIYPQAETGNEATAFDSGSVEMSSRIKQTAEEIDLSVRHGLEETGINISTHKVAVEADNFTVEKNGTQVFGVDANTGLTTMQDVDIKGSLMYHKTKIDKSGNYIGMFQMFDAGGNPVTYNFNELVKKTVMLYDTLVIGGDERTGGHALFDGIIEDGYTVLLPPAKLFPGMRIKIINGTVANGSNGKIQKPSKINFAVVYRSDTDEYVVGDNSYAMNLIASVTPITVKMNDSAGEGVGTFVGLPDDVTYVKDYTPQLASHFTCYGLSGDYTANSPVRYKRFELVSQENPYASSGYAWIIIEAQEG